MRKNPAQTEPCNRSDPRRISRISDVSTVTVFVICHLTCITAFIFLLAGSSYSNWIRQEKENFAETEKTATSNFDKKDSLPEGLDQEWLNSLKDESGKQIMPEDSEGDAFQSKIFNGLEAGNQFGLSVSSAGDVNNDGYSDVIVGAHIFSSNTGRAYIFYGGQNMNTIADVTLTGEAAGNNFGYSVSSAGDVNADGYSDVIIGAYGYSGSTGRAYIYLGGVLMSNTAYVTMTGEAAANQFGYSVKSAGDVNGDGYSDVIVGANTYLTSVGRAYVFYGGASMNNTSDLTLTGEGTGNFLGHSVSSADDMNSDGYSDVIVGAYGNNGLRGRAYIYFGGASMDNTADVTMDGEAANHRFGWSVSSAGDVNGDGYSDVVAGAYGYSGGLGRAYIFFGSALVNNTADVTFTGEVVLSFFGSSVSNAGDVNGDGYSDVIVGAHRYSTYTGRVYIYFGGVSMNNISDMVRTGENVNDNFGYSVSSAGDVNGNGYADIIAGSYGYSSSTGRVFLYDYFMKSEITHDVTMTGEATPTLFGKSVSNAGDVNGDGYSDVIVGANSYSGNTGRAYIFFGGTAMDNTADVTFTGEAATNQFGVSVSSAGDVNGDGYSDVIVGAFFYSSTRGRAYIYFGGASMNNVADIILTGEAVDNKFGVSVSSAGDVNGDAYSDVIVGADGFNSSTGRAYIYYGGESMNNVADVTMTGESLNTGFGYSASEAGDVNGDGYSDVLVGSVEYNSYTGRAYVFFGGASMNNVADVTMTGEASGHTFGFSVSSAGDINDDGYSDVIVGAENYNPPYTGRAYIFLGGASMNNIADVTLTGETINVRFGYSVSSAGDINADGYSDVIVGAPMYSAYTGRAYIFYGGASMDNTADFQMTGTANIQLGYSVSTAGDVNGDNYPDLIASAPDYSSFTGKANIFLGSAISTKPIFNHAKDVPNDQGGYINLKWARSSLDVTGNNTITGYTVYRSYPPTGGNFSWEVIASVAAARHSFYTFTSPTPYDSGINNSGNLFYKIRAKTSDVDRYWETAILSGRSVDNIAPLLVSPFTAAAVANDVRLTWKRSSAPDLFNYVLYRSTSPTIDPETEPVFVTTTDSTYLDTSPLNGTYYYFIIAQDIHNNKSPVAVIENPSMFLKLIMLIEGFYNAGSNSQVSDTITVELRNATSPFAQVDVAKAVADTAGITVFKFNAANGNYYLAVKHRNSIETWTANPVALTSEISVSYSFSISSSQAYGSNMIQVDTSPISFAFYSGDVNQDGTVDATDVSLIDNDASNFVSGYVVTDLTGDDFVDGTDFAIADNNAANFVSVVRP